MKPTVPSGEQLYEKLCSAAQAAGVSVEVFASPMFPAGQVRWKLEQMRIAHRPLKRTIDRIQALISGEEFTPAKRSIASLYNSPYQRFTRAECDNMGLPPSGRALRERQSLQHIAREKDRIELLRRLTERAHFDRRPGQSIADRVRELRTESRA
jgi:hypothetical protein